MEREKKQLPFIIRRLEKEIVSFKNIQMYHLNYKTLEKIIIIIIHMLVAKQCYFSIINLSNNFSPLKITY